MTAKTPRLELTEVNSADFPDALSVNDTFYALDAIIQLAVLDKDKNVPPDDSQQGDVYIVGSTPGGVWLGHKNHVAYLTNTGWKFRTPRPGWSALVLDEASQQYIYSGIAWVAYADVGRFQKGASWSAGGDEEVALPTNDVIAILPRDCTLKQVTLLGLEDMGSCVVGISSVISADYPPDPTADDITGGSPPEIDTGTEVIDTTLTSWTKKIFVKGDSLRFSLVSSDTFTFVQIILEFD